jgi:hypothetical protein
VRRLIVDANGDASAVAGIVPAQAAFSAPPSPAPPAPSSGAPTSSFRERLAAAAARTPSKESKDDAAAISVREAVRLAMR